MPVDLNSTLTVSKKFILLKVTKKLMIDKAFKDHTNHRNKINGTVISSQRMLIDSLKSRDNGSHFP